jgi:D-glycero-D-manno-heptose 1,7-bisphosphate phosphatase
MSTELRPAVFVDKDGTLVDDVPYNVEPALLNFRPGTLAALATLAASGFALVIVTNQSGIARGLFDEAQFAALRSALLARIRREAGLAFTGFEHCPHAPGADGLPTCGCRKPMPGMLRRAALAHRLDLARSWMVGDTLDDVEAGHRAGCRSILYDSGGETVWRRSPARHPEAVIADWDEVAHWILASRRHDGGAWRRQVA